MSVNRSYTPYGSTPEPDFTSSAAALEMSGLSRQTSPPDNRSPLFGSQKAKPSIPQKKKNVDEIYRVKRELEDALRGRDEAVEKRDMMEDDLIQAQEDLSNKIDELERVTKEMVSYREKAEAFSRQLSEQKTRQSFTGKERVPTPTRAINAKREAEQWQMRRQIEDLTAALAEKDVQLNDKASIAVSSKDQMQSFLQETQIRFESELKQREDQFHSRCAEEQKLRQTAEAELTRVKEKYEIQLRETEQLANKRVEEESKRAQASQIALNEQMSRMEIDSSSQQQHEQVIAAYEAQIHDQRQRCNQFRRTSERLTTQIKQAMDAKRDIERSDQEMRQQLEDVKSQAATLRLQLREYRMPGSYQDNSSRLFS